MIGRCAWCGQQHPLNKDWKYHGYDGEHVVCTNPFIEHLHYFNGLMGVYQ